MSVILKSGASGDLAGIDTQHKAVRTSVRPNQADVGYFQIAGKSGLIAASLAANSPIFAFRGPNTGVCVVQRVRVACFLTVAGAAGMMELQMVVARSYTASDTSGNILSVAANNQKKRSSFSTSGVQSIIIANTAALSAGTRTLDTTTAAGATPGQCLSSVVFAQVAGAGSTLLAPTYLFEPSAADHQLVLAANEGFIIQNHAAWPATGTPILFVNVEWFEATAF